MSGKNIDRCYTIALVFFVTVAVAFIFVVAQLWLNEHSWDNEYIPYKLNNVIKNTDSSFENDEFLKVFHEISKGCDDQLYVNVDMIPENELNELYSFLTQNHAHVNFDAQSQKGKKLVSCAISAAENLGVPAHMLPEFIGYIITAASHSNRDFEPDAFLVYAAENFAVNHNEWESGEDDSSSLYNFLDIIFEFTVYFLLITFLFLLMRIERNTRK